MAEFDYLEHYKIDAEKFDYFQRRNGATAHEELRIRQFIISKVSKNTSEILDVGCGTAWVAEQFLKKERKVCSLDISSLNPMKAIEKFPNKYHYGITADSFSLPFKNESFSCVIASEIIEHVVDPQKFITELFRVVKKDGQLIITTPYKEKIRYYLCVHCNKMTPANAHLHSFDENKLKSLYQKGDLCSFKWSAFGNKYLIFLRTHILFRIFPFRLWHFFDKIANLIFPKPLHIIVEYKKD